MSNVIEFKRYLNCKGMTIPEIREWFKKHNWKNVRFNVENLDNVIAERLPDGR